MKNLIIIIFFAASLTSCSKEFLDQKNPNQLDPTQFFLKEDDAFYAVNGIYDVLQDRILYSGGLNGTIGFPMYDNFGDNSYNSYKFEGPGNFMIANIDPSAAIFKDLWASLYKGIYRANNAIENIEKMSPDIISSANKKALIGQALFLRALFYSHLAVYYEDAPLILKPQLLENSYVPKNTYQELSTQIVADLKAASDSLPTSYPATQYGYATKGAALGLLARFALYNKDYQTVLDATNTVMTLGYSLNANYAPLFTEAGENSREIIFSVRFLTNILTNNNETFSATFTALPKVDEQPMPNLVREYNCTDGKPITSSPLYNPANPKNNRDPRLAASIYFPNDVFITDQTRIFTGNSATGFGKRKYVRSSGAVGAAGGVDFIVLRYADILLMRAEALIELNQITPLSTVTDLINPIRRRVNMPTVEIGDGAVQTQISLKNILRKERRVEFAFEGTRFFDLKRWGVVSDAFQRAINDNVPGYQVVYRDKKSFVFPIPQSEINANTKLVQHPAWQQ